jgi:hypothetical protein
VTARQRGPGGGDGRGDGAVPGRSDDDRAVWTQVTVTAGRTALFPGAEVMTGRHGPRRR